MLDTLKIYENLKEHLDEGAARAIAQTMGEIYESEFMKLRVAVEDLMRAHKELADAQRRSEERLAGVEERLTRLEKTVAQLAEAQRKTEERLNQLAEAQARSEERLTRLEKTVAQLAEAQAKSEERLARLEETVAQLAEAQRKTEERLNQLAEAQARSEERLTRLEETQMEMIRQIEKLARGLRRTREEVGGLAHTIGYRLEDESFKALPALLKRDLKIEVIGRLKRDYVEVAPGKYVEVNIFGSARRNGEEFFILGEAKSQLKKKDVDRFVKKCNMLIPFLGKDQIRVLVTYQTSPQIRRYIDEKGIKLYFSYDF